MITRHISIALIPLIFLCAAAEGQTTRPTTRPFRVMGTLYKVDGSVLVIKPRSHALNPVPISVATDEHTLFRVDSDPGRLADLKPGMQITVVDLPPLSAKSKTRLTITAFSKGLSGTIDKIAGNLITLAVAKSANDVQKIDVVTDDDTRIFLLAYFAGGKLHPGAEKTFADLQVNMRVKVLPETGTATKIFALPLDANPQ